MSNLVTTVTTEKEAPEWYERFLTLLSDYGNVTTAASGAGISRLTAYRYRNTDMQFAEQWEAALELGISGLEDEARRRAFTGSDTLLIFMLKSLRPEIYRETIRQQHTNVQIDWEKVDPAVRDAFIEGRVTLDDVLRKL